MPPASEKTYPAENSRGLPEIDSSRIRQDRDKLENLKARLASPAAGENKGHFRELAKEYARLEKLVSLHDEYLKISREIAENRALLEKEGEDEEFLELVRNELAQLAGKQAAVKDRLEDLLSPSDERDERDIIVEIRAGTGGEEAALFAADLFRMYGKYAEREGLKIKSMDTHPAALGGLKEVVFAAAGKGAYRAFKYESGVHRVQRVPETESGGRIHTSAATVAVLPEAEEVEVKVDPQDLRIDTFCSSGPGGQSVNTTYSAIRITHLPTGLVVSCQDEKSQHKNKASAMKVLRARLLERMRAEREAELSQQRKSQIKSGDRSDKIRTYNYPQNRVTDHRINYSLHQLDQVMDGALDKIVDRLRQVEREERLRG
jgi:peptide chain release factor 1